MMTETPRLKPITIPPRRKSNLLDEGQLDLLKSATLEVLEPMGNELFLYLTTGKHPIVARVDVHETPEVGQKLDLIFDMSKAHFFDKDTEEAID